MNLVNESTLVDLESVLGRGPLGDLALIQGLKNLAQGDPQEQGARNLLVKAMRSIVAGEDARAEAFIGRAAALRSSVMGQGLCVLTW
jgi:hypothetical protein